MAIEWESVWMRLSVGMTLLAGFFTLAMTYALEIASPIYRNLSQENTFTFLLESQLFVGGFVVLASLVGCCCCDRPERIPSLKIFMLVHGVLAAVQAAMGVAFLVQSNHPELRQCVVSGNDTSAACTALIGNDHWTTGYYMWQQVWVHATASDASLKAEQLLQAIQNEGQCCGFGTPSACVPPTSLWTQSHSFLFRNCSVTKANYCSVAAVDDATIIAKCRNDSSVWDFPFGGEGQGDNGRCLEKNMANGGGCFVTWLQYLDAQALYLGIMWCIVAIIEVSCVVASGRFVQVHEGSIQVGPQERRAQDRQALLSHWKKNDDGVDSCDDTIVRV
ncbi:Aste57867_4628 [Aphanomyces stellatus]|uniref:Aste57867_4628 protein n=1 Tax=Aphanomyces stellatus TaxID=120398 RepID=A0A485KG58_9STRA|nr:hypothetical protein As57867_004615 [Aphanomyces stellatus]VFT81732.1 Aste57867_4628 [Aphanomyces stellatus]